MNERNKVVAVNYGITQLHAAAIGHVREHVSRPERVYERDEVNAVNNIIKRSTNWAADNICQARCEGMSYVAMIGTCATSPGIGASSGRPHNDLRRAIASKFLSNYYP